MQSTQIVKINHLLKYFIYVILYTKYFNKAHYYEMYLWKQRGYLLNKYP